MDIRIVNSEIKKAKELIQSVMEGLRAERDNMAQGNAGGAQP